MKLVVVPILQCTGTEYKTEIEPIIKTLDDLDLCPTEMKSVTQLGIVTHLRIAYAVLLVKPMRRCVKHLKLSKELR